MLLSVYSIINFQTDEGVEKAYSNGKFRLAACGEQFLLGFWCPIGPVITFQKENDEMNTTQWILAF